MIASGRVKKIAELGIFESEIFTQSGLFDVDRDNRILLRKIGQRKNCSITEETF